MTTTDASETRPRVDQAEVQRLVRQLLIAIGEDPDRDGLLETPARIARTARFERNDSLLRHGRSRARSSGFGSAHISCFPKRR